MKYTVKAFGSAREMVGGRQIEVELSQEYTAGALRNQLIALYPALAGLRSLMIAVNQEYANDDHSLNETDEIALIPPVSGG